MDFETGLAGGGITAAVVALIYGFKKLMERSSCHSDNSCCQVDIAAIEEQVRQKPQRDQKDLVALVLLELKKDREKEDEKWEDNTV